MGVTALIERNGDFLVERRIDDADVWAFIGGTLEDDETLVEALRREVREETGFEVDAFRLLGLFSDPTRIVAYPDGTVCQVLSVAFHVVPRGMASPIESHESAGMQFVSADELGRLSFWPAQVPIRDALLGMSQDPVVA